MTHVTTIMAKIRVVVGLDRIAINPPNPTITPPITITEVRFLFCPYATNNPDMTSRQLTRANKLYEIDISHQEKYIKPVTDNAVIGIIFSEILPS